MRIPPFLYFSSIFLPVGLFAAPTPSVNACTVLARVIGSRRPLTLGQGLCRGQAIVFPVRAVCNNARKVVWVNRNEDLDQCRQALPANRRFLGKPKSPYLRMRTEVAQVKPWLLQPYGETLLASPLEIQWSPVAGADYYAVTAIGNKVWKSTSYRTRIQVPTIPGSSVQFVVEAFVQGRFLSSSSTTFNLLSMDQAKQVNDDLARIDQFQISLKEKDALRLSIFTDSGLLDDSVRLVQNSLLANPTKRRLLGDIFLEAGLIDNASTSYLSVMEVADKILDREEIDRSVKALRIIASWKQQQMN
jgi:hypothetical protein